MNFICIDSIIRKIDESHKLSQMYEAGVQAQDLTLFISILIVGALNTHNVNFDNKDETKPLWCC